MSAAELELFIACLPGLEQLLADELVELGIAEPVDDGEGGHGAGGLTVMGSWADVHRIHLGSALAGHVSIRLARFPARAFAMLEGGAARVPWADWLPPGIDVGLDVTAKKSRLYHTGAIAQRVAKAIERVRPDVRLVKRRAVEGDGPQPLAVAVRIVDNRATLSLDVTGMPLHRRGYRLRTAKAPLREDLAAALVRVSGWVPGSPLCDPLAGSGTIVIEAARRTAGVWPAPHDRPFACEQLGLFDADTLSALRASSCEAARSVAAGAGATLWASDRDRGAVEAIRENARRAGVEQLIEAAEAPLGSAPGLGSLDVEGAGAVVTNPPYGRRVAGRSGGAPDLRPLYQSLGKQVRVALPDAGRAAVCALDRRLALATGLKLRTGWMTKHGGLTVRAMVGAW